MESMAGLDEDDLDEQGDNFTMEAGNVDIASAAVDIVKILEGADLQM